MRVSGVSKNPKIYFFISAILCTAALGKIIYVDDDANGTNDGTSWENAYVHLQEALADAKGSQKHALSLSNGPVEIRVAQGTYKPDGGIIAVPEFDRRTLSFQLISGVSLKGGYAGVTAPDPNACDIELYETTLSGDLNGDDGPDFINNSENSYHVVTGDGTDETAILDGFTITAGNSSGENPTGGGMYNISGSPTVTNCIFNNNSGISGGGVYNDSGSNPTFNNCQFITNSSGFGGGMWNSESNPRLADCFFIGNAGTDGAGLYNFSCNPTLTGCTFEENSSQSGGGISNRNSNPILINCTFNSNSALLVGGGIYNRDSNPILNNCTFNMNSAIAFGGGVCDNASDSVLTNCIFSGNFAQYSGGGVMTSNANPFLSNCTFAGNESEKAGAIDGNYTLMNCIVWGNAIPQIEGYATASYSNVQGGWEGEGNIDTDPLFANISNGDYHLKSQAGRWDPNSESWVIDDVTSPCIDAGDPNSDWTGETWPHGERINMGAYGGTPEASMSTRPEQMSLPEIAYIYESNAQAAESFQSLLITYGCPTNLIKLNEVSGTSFDSYELIIVADDTDYVSTWGKPGVAVAIEDSGKPIVGLGKGGYYLFGELDLSIGSPHGGHGSTDSITVLDPNLPLFSSPYPIDLPGDSTLQLYTETEHISIYLWPEPPETVTVLAQEANSPGYYPLVMEHDRYLLWGFTESPQKMTEVGRKLFMNVIIRAANSAW